MSAEGVMQNIIFCKSLRQKDRVYIITALLYKKRGLLPLRHMYIARHTFPEGLSLDSSFLLYGKHVIIPEYGKYCSE